MPEPIDAPHRVQGFGCIIRRCRDDSPQPWSVEKLEAGFKIVDANKQAIAYVYGHADPRDASTAKALTLDEARRIAANIAKLPKLLRREV